MSAGLVVEAELAGLDRARSLALESLGDVEPNPMVGAVVLRDGVVVGEGRHRHYGGAHAELEALQGAAERAMGSTLCVTLEPCSSQGKTPPCVDAIRAAGVARVVVGAVDPDTRHQGRGLKELRAAGIDVVLLDDPGCQRLLDRFRATLRRSRPHVFAKWAMSSDGAIAGPEGATEWLTGEASWERVHTWRAHLDAILVGVGTVAQDDPLLTARGTLGQVRPLRRVVLDPTLRTTPGAQVVTTADETATWIITGDDVAEERRGVLEEAGVRLLALPLGPDWLEAALDALRLEGVGRLMIEGGARTLTRAFAAEVVDDVAVFLSPRVLGRGALPALTDRVLPGDDIEALTSALDLTGVRTETVGDDTLVRGVVKRG